MTVLSFPKGTYHQSLPVGNSHWGKGNHKTFGDYCTPGLSWHGLPSTKVSSWTPVGVGLWETGNGILIKIQFTVHPLVPWILQWSFLQSWGYNQNWYIRAGLTVSPYICTPELLISNLRSLFPSRPLMISRPLTTAQESMNIFIPGYFSLYTKWVTRYTTHSSSHWEDLPSPLSQGFPQM